MDNSLFRSLGKRLLRPVERQTVMNESVEVVVFAGDDHRPARSADGIRAETVPKQHALIGDSVKIRRCVDLRSVTTDGMRSVVVREDKQDVGPSFGCIGT